jgi:hypothetical protein
MTKYRHKLSTVWQGPFGVVEVTRDGWYRLQWEDDFEVPNSWNIDQRPAILYVGNLVYIILFCLLH